MLWRKLVFGVLEKTLFLVVLGAWMNFKKPKMDKTLWNRLSMIETGAPQPQMVGFRNLLGTGIPPLSKKKKLLGNFRILFGFCTK